MSTLSATDELAGWELNRRLPPALRTLRNHIRGTRAERTLDALQRDADLAAGATSVDETEAAEMTRAYAWLLRRVGGGGGSVERRAAARGAERSRLEHG